ncbi:Cortactin-binding protein [Wickerhamomyces ciferrii]|uniref:Cortactin-binding protein n=1 Tax=Wickerhamomyces ciferrii (strain ATCC 14091 / BCRC 22168 / CBS 111 / JCM 3599 / NBRC 0793 / NRRL Y-1031 F-60-10) TaxID=1206466 RepID=K0KW45_WICCF|nr:Cortactin-binding protein [Wickerhamomyces ciferrii]CCH45724.1 Cortactin-binding protein [Wickerhamomyces ciferrii]
MRSRLSNDSDWKEKIKHNSIDAFISRKEHELVVQKYENDAKDHRERFKECEGLHIEIKTLKLETQSLTEQLNQEMLISESKNSAFQKLHEFSETSKRNFDEEKLKSVAKDKKINEYEIKIKELENKLMRQSTQQNQSSITEIISTPKNIEALRQQLNDQSNQIENQNYEIKRLEDEKEFLREELNKSLKQGSTEPILIHDVNNRVKKKKKSHRKKFSSSKKSHKISINSNQTPIIHFHLDSKKKKPKLDLDIQNQPHNEPITPLD